MVGEDRYGVAIVRAPRACGLPALEAAQLHARGVARQAEEVGLTLVFLRVLRVWLGDASPGQRRTRAFLRRNLGWLDRLPRRPAPGRVPAVAAPRSSAPSC